jgi:hypothetical protein
VFFIFKQGGGIHPSLPLPNEKNDNNLKNMNAKNQLQIYCQRGKLELPKYSYVQDQDTKMWYSTVEIISETGAISRYTGDPQAKKVAADISAASAALNSLGINNDDTVSPMNDTESKDRCPHGQIWNPMDDDRNPVFVLIDYENVNKLEYLHNLFVNQDGFPAYVSKFVGYCNQKASTDECSHVVPTASSDGVDHYISFYIGMLYHQLKQRELPFTIIILTRDKFGSHYPSFCGGIHCATERECIKLLEQRGYYKTSTVYVYN